jgi:hypothetical protein
MGRAPFNKKALLLQHRRRRRRLVVIRNEIKDLMVSGKTCETGTMEKSNATCSFFLVVK